jgi:hypothetical protein
MPIPNPPAEPKPFLIFKTRFEILIALQRWFDGQWVPRKTLERFGVLEPEWEEDIETKEVG